jgi:hypothetical protein
MSEVLAPRLKDISDEFNRGFDGMTDRPVAIDELLSAREALIKYIVGKMPEAHRRFLISFETGKPEWEILDLPHVAHLPAVTWRQFNLDKTTAEKRATLVEGLKKVLTE